MAVSRSLRLIAIAVLLIIAAAGVFLFRFGYWARMGHQSTIDDRVKQYGPAVRERVQDEYQLAVGYPPPDLTLLALKRERRLEVWSTDRLGKTTLVHSYHINGLSGGPGPKLKEGDKQVPEGIYGIESLNPNSRYHLSLRVSYPNDDDRARAHDEGRTDLGGDIMIHGGSSSIGCLAIGDEAAEDLFVVAAETGIEKLRVIIAPCDFRKGETVDTRGMPGCTTKLYEQLREEMDKLKSF